MKKFSSVLVAIGLLAVSSSAFAHPPSAVTLVFDPATKTISVSAEHAVSRPKFHFIKKIDVSVNGKQVKEFTFLEQENKMRQRATYVLADIKADDIIAVKATCNLIGSKEEKLTVK